MENEAKSRITRWLQPAGWRGLALVLPVVLVVHFFAAALTIRHSNQDSTKSDQGAEMWLAEMARGGDRGTGDLFPARTDGVRHPLWSWLARSVYASDPAEFFARGKWLNTALCLVFLAGLGAAVCRWLDPLALANLLFLVSLGILLVRGTYFQPEPLYYGFSFCAAVLAWRLLGGAGLGWWALFGVICGLAYLSKPSLAPFLLVFGAAFALRVVLALRGSGWSVAGNLSGAVLAGVLFAVMLTPLALFSASHFGRPLFNYTKYWMWMDDFEKEAWPFQKAYPGGKELQALRAEDTPSPGWYFRRHSAAEAAARLGEGMQAVAVRFVFPEPKVKAAEFFWRKNSGKWEQPLTHRGVYLFVLAALIVGLCLPARAALVESLSRADSWARLAFVVMVLGIYVALYGWYWPIGKGDRFMGSLWIPTVFLLVWLAARLRERAATVWTDTAYLGVHGILLAALGVQIVGLFWKFHQGIYLVTRN